MNLNNLFDKLEFACKVAESSFGKILIRRISDETLYSLIGTAANLVTKDNEKIVAVINILDTIKPDVTWGQFLTEEANIAQLRALLQDARKLGGQDANIL